VVLDVTTQRFSTATNIFEISFFNGTKSIFYGTDVNIQTLILRFASIKCHKQNDGCVCIITNTIF
jgi:hypothetical protein